MRLTGKFLIIGIWLCCLSYNAIGQNRIRSLKMEQYTIEQSIKESLNAYLSPQDYVLKVWLEGAPVYSQAAKIVDEGLPGFEPNALHKSPSAQQQPSHPEYWEVTKMKIDLILYRSVSPSFSTYLSEIIPILSGLITERGDEFNFMPIVPSEEEQKEIAASEEAEPSLNDSEIPVDEGLSTLEWILIAGLLLIALSILLMFWRIGAMQASILAKAHEPQAGPQPSNESALVTMEDVRKQRMEEQKASMQNLLLQEENTRLVREILKYLVGREERLEEMVEEFQSQNDSNTKFSQFVAVLGPQTARKLFAPILGIENYIELEAQAQEVELDEESASSVLRMVRNFLFSRELSDPEDPVTDPFEFLRKLTVSQIHFLVDDEPVKIKAIVISRLDGTQAAGVLEKVDKEHRSQILVQIGRLKEIPLELVEKVAYNLAEKAKALPDDHTVAFDGVNLLVDVMGLADSQTRQEMLNGLKVTDQGLSEEVESQLFVFDSIPVVPSELLTEVVRTIDPADVITALVGASTELQKAVILCFPENIRKTLVSSLKAQTADDDAVREKRQIIVRSMQKMAVQGRINLKEINAEWSTQESQTPAIDYEEENA